MGDKLLVRAYNVGLGDCIYVRIPEPKRPFHILIDCGTWSDSNWLLKAIEHLENDLPLEERNGVKKRILDLLVVTHRHHDHIAGFGLDLFKNIHVENLWVSVAMNQKHPQAEGLRKFNEETQTSLASLPITQLDPVLADEVQRNIIPDEKEVNTLLTGLGVEPTYVYARMPKYKRKLPLKETEIHILAPEWDIDRYYLGRESVSSGATSPDNVSRAPLGMNTSNQEILGITKLKPGEIPADLKISKRDFRQLQNRMMVSALAFAHFDNSFRNNTSVVLLIEWGGRRLLFTGDAEWHGRYKNGKQNGSWNVMWHKKLLDKEIDFLKVGHHGSVNATPWIAKPKNHEVNDIFNTLLPLPNGNKKPTAKAIVSTERGRYKTIPGVDLVRALGPRVANSVVYKNKLSQDQQNGLNRYDIEKQTLDFLQPCRTDFEYILTGDNFVEVEIEKTQD